MRSEQVPAGGATNAAARAIGIGWPSFQERGMKHEPFEHKRTKDLDGET